MERLEESSEFEGFLWFFNGIFKALSRASIP
jgi:hypothetical protein